MNEFSSDEPADIDQEIRINELREAAREAAGGEMTEWESPDMPPELAESFWGNVLAYESADETCHFTQLTESGVDLPEPDSLDEAAVTAKLWEVIYARRSSTCSYQQPITGVIGSSTSGCGTIRSAR